MELSMRRMPRIDGDTKFKFLSQKKVANTNLWPKTPNAGKDVEGWKQLKGEKQSK